MNVIPTIVNAIKFKKGVGEERVHNIIDNFKRMELVV